jgi:hypothetical protein
MTIDLGHIIVDFEPSSKDGKWNDFNGLAEKEGFRLPTLAELRYLYSLKKDLGIGNFPRDWFWSSEEMGATIYSSGAKYYFKDFRDGLEDWEYANMRSACLIRIYDK